MMRSYAALYLGLFLLGAVFVILAVVPVIDRLSTALDGLAP